MNRLYAAAGAALLLAGCSGPFALSGSFGPDPTGREWTVRVSGQLDIAEVLPTWTPTIPPTAVPTAEPTATSTAPVATLTPTATATASATAPAPPAPTSAPATATPPASPATTTAVPTTAPLVRLGFEHRPENAAANREVRARDDRWRAEFVRAEGGKAIAGTYWDRLGGDGYVGTTAELILHYADKWGVPRVQALAQAWKETSWRTALAGDFQAGRLTPWGDFTAVANQSYGLLQVKRFYFPDSWPKVVESSGYGLDYGFMRMRLMFDGNNWLGERTRGSWDAALEAYFAGQPGTAGGIAYRQDVRQIEQARPWRGLE